jgi:hypothetical protein
MTKHLGQGGGKQEAVRKGWRDREEAAREGRQGDRQTGKKVRRGRRSQGRSEAVKEVSSDIEGNPERYKEG